MELRLFIHPPKWQVVPTATVQFRSASRGRRSAFYLTAALDRPTPYLFAIVYFNPLQVQSLSTDFELWTIECQKGFNQNFRLNCA